MNNNLMAMLSYNVHAYTSEHNVSDNTFSSMSDNRAQFSNTEKLTSSYTQRCCVRLMLRRNDCVTSMSSTAPGHPYHKKRSYPGSESSLPFIIMTSLPQLTRLGLLLLRKARTVARSNYHLTTPLMWIMVMVVGSAHAPHRSLDRASLCAGPRQTAASS
jgi:hypothetical protein